MRFSFKLGFDVDHSVDYKMQNITLDNFDSSPSECYMKLESVKLEKQVVLHGEESKCYSVEPVLRCLSGCTPLRSIPVTVGFHCLPAGKSKPLKDNRALLWATGEAS